MHSQHSTVPFPRNIAPPNATVWKTPQRRTIDRGFKLLACFALVAAWLSGTWPSVACAQNKTAKKAKTATKKSKTDDQEESPEKPLEEIDFDSAPIKPRDGDTPSELDATAEGRKRLAVLEGRAKEIFKDRDRIESELRPLVIPRDRLVGEVALLNQGILNAQQAILQGQNQLRKLQQQLDDGGNANALNNQIQTLQNQLAMANKAITFNQEEIAERTPEITALNLQIEPLNLGLVKLWVELNDFRKQWLEIRQPQSKYAHGNFEALKQVIDDWVLIDGLWPEAFCWAALTNYELGNYEAAWDNVERAAELRKTLRFSKAWAQGEALRGMIAAQIPERRGKAAGHLQSAQLYVNKDKNTNWQAFFLVGRAVVENDKQAAKARTNFDKALKINPDAACVKYWNAHLQITTTTSTVRDVATGTKTLEALWEKSTKQSWRLAHKLVLAYDAAYRKADADRTWAVVLELAPKEKHDELQEARAAAAEKLKTADGDEDTPKSKSKSKTTGKSDD
ncbi:MAG: hypothetical protein JWN70_145 [Planctomycetaceae bacterium]|nr:hypothetical protein [Planctomycetaceae bacterium]